MFLHRSKQERTRAFGAQAAAKRMVRKGGGSIINMSSIAGIQGGRGTVTYSTSKGAARLLTYALADELGELGIRVNAIHPGVIETAMTIQDAPIVGTEQGNQYMAQIPLRRFGKPTDIGDTAVYLASDLASYVSGASLVVDGGRTRV
jgi:NAD(P)-dependent dehydrogenase (short-subunit alcohol dehydrogenase family)